MFDKITSALRAIQDNLIEIETLEQLFERPKVGAKRKQEQLEPILQEATDNIIGLIKETSEKLHQLVNESLPDDITIKLTTAHTAIDALSKPVEEMVMLIQNALKARNNYDKLIEQVTVLYTKAPMTTTVTKDEPAQDTGLTAISQQIESAEAEIRRPEPKKHKSSHE